MVRLIYDTSVPDLTIDTHEDAQNFEFTTEEKEMLWHLFNGHPGGYRKLHKMIETIFRHEDHKIVQELRKYGAE